jgi:hypothetical protein
MMGDATTSKTWVVYQMRINGNAVGGNVVCEQREWDAIESARPGYHTLLHAGIRTEQEAEKLARGTAGDTFRKGVAKKTPVPAVPPPAPPTA